VNTNDYPTGDFSAITNNFELVLDSGDGSLLTRSVDEADLPHFDEMRFAPGTTLDLNGNAYVASTLSGFPTVTSSAEDASAAPSLTITNRFVVNAADIVAGKKLSLAMPLTFGANAGVTVTNLAALARGFSYVLAEVTGEGNAITAASGFRQRRELDSSKWDLMLSSDGKTLLLVPAPGFQIKLR